MPIPTKIAFTSLAAASVLLAFGAFAHADSLADIQKAGVIKVGVFEDFPPFSSVGGDMSLKGYDIDVAQGLGTALKVKVSRAGRRPSPTQWRRERPRRSRVEGRGWRIGR